MPDRKPLHLKAETDKDLQIISGAAQDAILRVEGLIYDSKARSLTLGFQRFRHEVKKPSRIISGLRFDSVLSVKSAGIDRSKKDAFLVLLSIGYEDTDSPAGKISLEFAGDGHIIIDVECLDVMLLDQGDPWFTQSVPDHKIE